MIELDKNIQARITEKTVLESYNYWKDRGLLDATNNILNQIEPHFREPIEYSFVTHVYKEKGLFIDLIGDSISTRPDIRQSLAASADILWSLSLIIDDLVDGDISRGGRPSAWTVYGEERAFQSAHIGLLTTLQYLERVTGINEISQQGYDVVIRAVKSLDDHKKMSLLTPEQEIDANYEARCNFHGAFQLEELLKQAPDIDQIVKTQAVKGLRNYYKAGQLINDLKDLIYGDLYRRDYSDIRNGLPTIPILRLFSSLNEDYKRRFQKLFGNRQLSIDDMNFINTIVQESNLVNLLIIDIRNGYFQGIELMRPIIKPEYLKWFNEWAYYKINLVDKKDV